MSLLANSNAIESGGYNIDRSLRFRSSASAYLSRTPASAGNRQKWTWSGWVKKGSLNNGGSQWIWGANNTVLDSIVLDVNANGTCNLSASINSADAFYTTASYRDPSAWYHIIIAVDTTQATASNRIIPYVNGVQVTSFSYTNYPSQNTNTATNAAVLHTIGRRDNGSNYFDGYLAEVNFIDGQALTPSSFGETDTETGVWKPKKYAGTYGTNGFYLDFKDNTSATTLAYDKSGNGNNWTPNNISTTAGSTYDSMLDVPTLTSATAANFAVWNPLDRTAATYSEGNLKVVSSSAAGPYNMTATIQTPLSGKFYWEVDAIKGSNNPAIGIGNNRPSDQFAMYRSGGTYLNGNISGISSSGTPASWTTNDIIGCAYDVDAGTLVFYKNGVAQTGGFSGIPATGYFPAIRADSASGDGGYLNCGQRPFSYTPPTGFKALNTFNLPDPTIKKPNQYMDATLYTGTNANQTVTNAGSFQPDLVWTKSRSNSDQNVLCDSVRGPTLRLISNLTIAEVSNGLTSINSNGFSLGDASTSQSMNNSGESYVGWQWKKGATPGFDIVTYTGDGVAGRTVAHNLGVAPAMMIVKNRNSTQGWQVQHQSLTSITYNLYLQATDSQQNDAQFLAKSATTVTLNQYSTNTNGNTYVMYLFAEIAGFSKFGSYTGNGSTDGPFVYCGFRPKYVMVKRTDSTSDWGVYDSARDTYNQMTDFLFPNASYAETAGYPVDFLSNGFKMRNSAGFPNNSGGTFIFAAFAENPMKYSLAK